MDLSDAPHATRRMSDRKSKPSMEALVDNHRFIPLGNASSSTYRLIHQTDFDDVAYCGDSPDGSTESYRPRPVKIKIKLSKLDEATVLEAQRDAVSFSHVVSKLPHPDLSKLDTEVRLRHPPEGCSAPASDDEDDIPLSALCKRAATTVKHSPPSIDPRLNHVDVNNECDEEGVVSATLSNFYTCHANVETPAAVSVTKECVQPVVPKSQIIYCCAGSCKRPAAVRDTRWDGQFCSSSCLIAACHTAFRTHIQMSNFKQKVV